MKKDYLKIGDEVQTVLGYLKLTYYNGSIFYFDEYELTWENEDANSDELVYQGERMLTAVEVGHLMQEVDGCNHRVFFDRDEDEDED